MFAQRSVAIELVEVGFRGAYKVGSWAPVRLRLRAADRDISGTLTISVPDGDGVITALAAEEPVDLAAGETQDIVTYVKPGKLYGEWTAAVTASGYTLGRPRDFRPGTGEEGDFPRGLVQSRPLIGVLGVTLAGAGDGVESADDPTGLQALSHLSSRPDRQAVVVPLRTAADLPSQAIGYDGLDGLVLVLGGTTTLEDLAPARLEALRQWVRLGGRLMVSLGTEEAHHRANRLDDLMAETIRGTAQLGQMRGLEAYGNTGQPLPIEGQMSLSLLALQSGSVLASEGSVPLIVRRPYGFGSVTALAFDVSRPPFSAWAPRGAVWRRLFDLNVDSETQGSGGRLSHLRINDLASQLYAVLGQFETVRLVPFGAVAVLVLGYLLLAGPGDLFLVRRWFRRPEMTWLTFALLVVAVSGAGVLAANWAKGNRLRVNKIDLVDVDAEGGWVRGTSWFTLFSPEVGTYDLSVIANSVEPGASDGSNESPPVFLSWLGLPEDTIGGMYKQTGVRLLSRAYRYGEDGTSLANVPVETWSTKSFMGRWTSRLNSAVDANLESLGRDDVRGTFTLRLDAPLDDCLLAFGDRAYSLGTVYPRQPVRLSDQFSFRSLNGLLTNKTLIGQEIRSTRYDRATYERDPLMRMMLFHGAAGGEEYTELKHAYLGFTDLSGHLSLGRAILVGMSAGWSGSRLLCDGEPIYEADLNERTYVRLVLPVARTTGSSN